jgi:SH3 domain protein
MVLVKTVFLRRFVLLLLCSITAPVMAESVYVIDVLRVGVRASPTAGGPSETVVKSGDRLEVLLKQGQYYRVRTADGTEGWVNKGYVSEEPTAAQRLAAVERENQRLRQEIDTLKAARGKEGEEIDALQQKLAKEGETLASVREERDEIKSQLNALTESKEGVFARYRWAFELLLAGIMLGVGLYFGRCSYRCRIRKRLGGMEF